MARACFLALLAVTGSAGPLDGCYRIEYRLSLMPDGSGKVDVLISQKLDNDELKQPFPLLEFVESTEGAVAFTPAATEVKDGWRTARFTAYFEDVNKLYYNDDGARKERCAGDSHDECLHFSLARLDTGFALTIEDRVFNKGPHRNPKENWKEIQEDSANVVQWNVTMPGKVTRVDGYQKMEGNSALYERSSETVKKLEDAVKWPLCGRRVVECGKPERSEAKQAAFKAEMQQAKSAWPKLKAELEAARAKEEKK